ncbi:hypothetical protein NQ318_003850 [Aromia moschata]|uniref:Uncharacterized protein n=1 Tax=Aromia moschata TaxID=1265417 RepID=A0AAV8Z9X3_9CUCU|nr:hypothetical protein NQ318_003850 [Aromia moschata]
MPSVRLILRRAKLAAEDPYSNSFISPNSAGAVHRVPKDTHRPAGDRTTGPDDILATDTVREEVATSLATETPASSIHERDERSADPILSRTAGPDDLLVGKHLEDSLDGNEVELSGRIGGFIRPSRTDKDLPSSQLQRTSTPDSGEEQGAPQARSLPLQEPHEITPSATTTHSFATPLYLQGKGRQANPDIQDIITGIVKLLNGNVNVQANTAPAMGRPLRPLSTRINNRGPPRITDIPALPPDFDVPAPLPLRR